MMNINHNDLYNGELRPTLAPPELTTQPNKLDNATLYALITAAAVGRMHSISRPGPWGPANIPPTTSSRRYSSPPVFTKPTGKPKNATDVAKKKAKTASKSKRINRKK